MATPAAIHPRETPPALPSGSWLVPLSRAVIAAVVALVITFSSDHSPSLGLTAFAAYALIEGAIQLVWGARNVPARFGRGATRAQGAIGVIAGILALIVLLAIPSAHLVGLLALVGGWALITGVLELVGGLRARGRLGNARDWIAVGGFTLLLAIAVLLVRPEFVHNFGGDGKVPPGVLNASIMTVGLFGAYAAIVAAYQAIAALSLKWAPTEKSVPAVSVSKGE
ncbi:hypothetical protein D9V32_10220 [Mycetocola tolaasinivorans]|uniref:Acyl-CoA synthetase n=1 Tax=Mycetocola tolaasinivorans TaxID=76635 RepID=A0A3L7A7E4_9MICO|nr:DUF308 domain-containing protein [Mycetocola tolaasinivorans]RLP75262.1 hypothetical protein D9V32_10220 [Mycetocola tolaasinivorans]